MNGSAWWSVFTFAAAFCIVFGLLPTIIKRLLERRGRVNGLHHRAGCGVGRLSGVDGAGRESGLLGGFHLNEPCGADS